MKDHIKIIYAALSNNCLANISGKFGPSIATGFGRAMFSDIFKFSNKEATEASKFIETYRTNKD